MTTIVIVGEGMLADTVCNHLSPFSIVRKSDFSEELPSAGLALVLGGGSSLRLQAEEKLQPLGIPWLCSYVAADEGVVGPLIRPGTPGCSQCAESRLSMAGNGQTEMTDDTLMNLLSAEPSSQLAEELSSAGARHMAHLVLAETARVLHGEKALTEGRVYLVNLQNLSTTIHYILPNPICPVCGQCPDDSKEAAEISLRPNKKLHPGEFRVRSMSELQKVLFKDYFDRRTGLFNAKQSNLISTFASAVVNLPLLMFNEVTGGRTHSYEDSELAAILEGLERHCGLAPLGKKTVVYNSFTQLKDMALDPAQVGFHNKKQYEQPDFPFQPFDSNASLAWVWGYSFLQERPILVPELLAYYSVGYGGGFVYETSNGCAIGGSLEEAILYGIMEVVERDSFLITWYAKLPVPRLDVRSSDDMELQLMVERLQAVTGYEVMLFNTTMDNGIPSILALAKGGTGDRANLVCAAGAHLDPIRAAKSALHELATIIPMTEERLRERREEAEAMLHDPFLVQRMEDHSLLYSLPQSGERLGFLLDSKHQLHTFEDQFAHLPARDDLTDDLVQVLQRFRSLQLDVIVIDQSTSETLRNDLYCVKVLIPGMLPMTFGHMYTRLEGLDRVLEVPFKLGYSTRKLSREDLNPYPHPFP